MSVTKVLEGICASLNVEEAGVKKCIGLYTPYPCRAGVISCQPERAGIGVCGGQGGCRMEAFQGSGGPGLWLDWIQEGPVQVDTAPYAFPSCVSRCSNFLYLCL